MAKFCGAVDILPLLIPIQKDVDSVLYRFAKEKSPRQSSFETFKNIWHDMNLHLIYSCKTSEEMFVFQDLLLDSVKHRLFPPYASLWNIGAVFLLFSFIELVPYRCLMGVIRPRLTLEDLKGVQKLMRYLRVEEEWEASVILLYVLKNYCQIVVHPMSDLFIDFRKQFSHRSSSQAESVNLANAARVASTNLSDVSVDTYIADQLESFGFLNKMTETNRQYCAMKALTPDVQKSSLCTLIGRDLIRNFADGTSAVQKNALETEHENSIGARRSMLKATAFATNTSTRKTEESPEEPVGQFGKRKKKRPVYEGNNKAYIRYKGSKLPVIESSTVVEQINQRRTYAQELPKEYKKKNSLVSKRQKMVSRIRKSDKNS